MASQFSSRIGRSGKYKGQTISASRGSAKVQRPVRNVTRSGRDVKLLSLTGCGSSLLPFPGFTQAIASAVGVEHVHAVSQPVEDGAGQSSTASSGRPAPPVAHYAKSSEQSDASPRGAGERDDADPAEPEQIGVMI